MGSSLNMSRLATLVRTKRGNKGLRETARAIGQVSPSTLSRVENGKMPDMETFLLLCDWLTVPPADLIGKTEEQETVVPASMDTSEAISIQLRADKNLDPATANALAALVKAAYQELTHNNPKEVTPDKESEKSIVSSLESLSPEFRQRCEAIATEQRSLFGLRAFEPLPARNLAAKLGATLWTPETVPNADPEQVRHLLSQGQWSAAIICIDPLCIVHNSQHSPPRQESDLMHECAHILLKHPMVCFNPETGLPQREQKFEEEATYLGSCLQIPRRGLLWATQKKMNVAEIGEHFGASQEMVSYRSNLTGVAIAPL